MKKLIVAVAVICLYFAVPLTRHGYRHRPSRVRIIPDHPRHGRLEQQQV